jgi:DNA-binding ferritin-like protein
MKTTEINRQIDVVAARAKALNIKTSAQMHRAVAKAELRIQKTAKTVADSAEQLALRARQLAKQLAPKPVRARTR